MAWPKPRLESWWRAHRSGSGGSGHFFLLLLLPRDLRDGHDHDAHNPCRPEGVVLRDDGPERRPAKPATANAQPSKPSAHTSRGVADSFLTVLFCMASLLRFFCVSRSFRLLPVKVVDGDHGQVLLVKRAQNAIQRGLIGQSPYQDTFGFSGGADGVSDLHPANVMNPPRVHASAHTDSVDGRSAHCRRIMVVPSLHRSNSMVRTLPELPGDRVSRDGPKTAHSCQAETGD